MQSINKQGYHKNSLNVLISYLSAFLITGLIITLISKFSNLNLRALLADSSFLPELMILSSFFMGKAIGLLVSNVLFNQPQDLRAEFEKGQGERKDPDMDTKRRDLGKRAIIFALITLSGFIAFIAPLHMQH